MLKRQVRQYLIDFLIGEIHPLARGQQVHKYRVDLVGYTSDPEEMRRYPIVIYPSSFFDRDTYGLASTLPTLPLQSWRGVPLLFGTPEEEVLEQGTLVIKADIVASTYFLVSRYEEMLRRTVRDEDGCFPVEESLPYRAGFLERPIVDEYGEVLRGIIEELGLLVEHGAEWGDPRLPYASAIHLGLSVCRPHAGRGVSGMWSSIVYDGISIREAWRLRKFTDPIKVLGKVYSWYRELEKSLPDRLLQPYLYMRIPSRHPHDRPRYRFRRATLKLMAKCTSMGGKLGLACSYGAALEPSLLEYESSRISDLVGEPVVASCYHLWAQQEPEDLVMLYRAGIRHDYSMGYRRLSGFRLGTSRPVRFINPNIRLLTDLVLHPVVLTGRCLSADTHEPLFGLDQELERSERLIRLSARYSGEINILWYLDRLVPESGTQDSALYKSLLHIIADVEHQDPRYQAPDTEEMRDAMRAHGFTELSV